MIVIMKMFFKKQNFCLIEHNNNPALKNDIFNYYYSMIIQKLHFILIIYLILK